MASQMQIVSKAGIIKMLENFQDKDHVGYVFTVQDGTEGECHQVLVFYKATQKIL